MAGDIEDKVKVIIETEADMAAFKIFKSEFGKLSDNVNQMSVKMSNTLQNHFANSVIRSQANLKRFSADIKKALEDRYAPKEEPIKLNADIATQRQKQAAESVIQYQKDMAVQSKKLKAELEDIGKPITRQMDYAKNAFSGFTQKMIDNAGATEVLGKKYDGFFKAMGMPFEKWQKFNKNMGEFNTVGGRFANWIRKGTQGLRGFRMELLGVMFFGGALIKTFTGLLQPALEVFGVFDLWRTMLQVLFIPIVELLFPTFIKLIEWIMNLDPATKEAIGKFVLLAIAIGGILAVVGTVGLAIGSIIGVFGGLFAIVDKLVPDFNLLGVNMSSFVEAGIDIGIIGTAFSALKGIINAVLGVIFKFDFVQTIFKKLGIEIDNHKTPWENLKTVVKGVVDFIKKQLGIVEKEAVTKEGAMDALMGKTDYTKFIRPKEGALGGIFGGLLSSLGIAKSSVTDFFKNMEEKIGKLDIDSISDSIDKISDSIGEMDFTKIQDAIDKFTTLLDIVIGIYNAMVKIKNFGDNTLGKFNTFMNDKSWDTAVKNAFSSVANVFKSTPQPMSKKEPEFLSFGDFVWRPGSAPISISPNDTLVGTKNGSGMGSVVVNNTFNTSVSDKSMFERMLDEYSRKEAETLRRLVGA